MGEDATWAPTSTTPIHHDNISSMSQRFLVDCYNCDRQTDANNYFIYTLLHISKNIYIYTTSYVLPVTNLIDDWILRGSRSRSQLDTLVDTNAIWATCLHVTKSSHDRPTQSFIVKQKARRRDCVSKASAKSSTWEAPLIAGFLFLLSGNSNRQSNN